MATAIPTWDRAEENERAYFALLAQTPPMQGAAVLINPDVPALLINRVMSLRLSPDNLARDLDQMEAFFLSRGIPPSVYLTPASRPSGIRRALLARGYRPEYRQTVMAYDLGAGPGLAGHGLENAPGPVGLTIVLARGPAEYQAWCQTFLSGFEVPRQMHGVMYEMNLRSLRQPGVTGLLGLLNGHPVATTCLYIAGDTAGIYAVSTVPRARRRGIAAALVRRALAMAREQGADLVVLQTATGGDPERLYRSLGFRELFVAEVLTKH